MGASKSKGGGASSGTAVDVRILQKQRRQQVATEFERLEKEDRRRRRAADQMAALQSPAAPFVPKRSAALEPRLRPSDYDAEAKRRMQDQLAWDSQTFVLNQLLLSVQFFDNYERYGVCAQTTKFDAQTFSNTSIITETHFIITISSPHFRSTVRN